MRPLLCDRMEVAFWQIMLETYGHDRVARAVCVAGLRDALHKLGRMAGWHL